MHAANLVAALADRGVEARHHKGKGRDAQELTQEEDDAHWADLHTRSPHHKGKGGNAGGAGGRGKVSGRDAQELTQEEDDAHWADLHTRSPHHKGKGGNAAGAGGRDGPQLRRPGAGPVRGGVHPGSVLVVHLRGFPRLGQRVTAAIIAGRAVRPFSQVLGAVLPQRRKAFGEGR